MSSEWKTNPIEAVDVAAEPSKCLSKQLRIASEFAAFSMYHVELQGTGTRTGLS